MSRTSKLWWGCALSLVAVAGLISICASAGTASAATSVKLGPGLWKTTGGGRFVSVKQFPGEKIDRRLRRDIGFLKRKYKIFLTDGYSLNPVHSANGEHPIGLALDIAPYSSIGGTWSDIDRLARFAEPSQNVPRPPFRWVGYNGDSSHGRGHHLHLSYAHSPTPYNTPAKIVYTLRDPFPDRTGTDPPDDGGDGSSGGVSTRSASTLASPDDGIVTRLRLLGETALAPIVPETGGVDLSR